MKYPLNKEMRIKNIKKNIKQLFENLPVVSICKLFCIRLLKFPVSMDRWHKMLCTYQYATFTVKRNNITCFKGQIIVWLVGCTNWLSLRPMFFGVLHCFRHCSCHVCLSCGPRNTAYLSSCNPFHHFLKGWQCMQQYWRTCSA